jgi:uncharacterized protein
VSARRPRLLIASVHDVAPRFETQVDELADTIQAWADRRFAMLVVPNHWDDCPIVPGSPFATRLRRWADCGIEMVLHGFNHRDNHEHRGFDRLRSRLLTAHEGEFLGLSTKEAGKRINNGRSLLEDVTGRPVTAFVAPAWLYGAGARVALAESGMSIAEDHWRVWSPRSGRLLARGPVVTWASRTLPRLCSALAAASVLRQVAPQRVLRIGVHPGDCSSPALLRSIRTTLASAAKDRMPALYRDLLVDEQWMPRVDSNHD